MAIIQLQWDCPACGQSVPGPVRDCPCGYGRDASTRLYAADLTAVTDREKLAEAARGPDWHCDRCGMDSPTSATRCKSCGDARTSEDAIRRTHDYAAGEAPQNGKQAQEHVRAQTLAQTRTRTAQRHNPQPLANQERHSSRASHALAALMIGLVVVVTALLGYHVFQALTPVPGTATIAVMEWDHRIRLEEIQPVEDSGWFLPSGANLLSQERRIRDYEDVLVGHEKRTRPVTKSVVVGQSPYNCGITDLGNGYAQTKTCYRDITKDVTTTESYDEPIYEKKPIYGTWYVYTEDRWTLVDTLIHRGLAPNPPTWPILPALRADQRAQSSSTYTIKMMTPEGRSISKSVPFATYAGLAVGMEVPIETRRLGGSRVVSWPAAITAAQP